MLLADAQPRRFTRLEYKALYDKGVLQPDERVELIDGYIVLMAAQNTPHKRGVIKCNATLQRALGNTHYVAPGVALELDDWSCPEPDFSLIVHSKVDETNDDFETADLIVEVSDSSLRFDTNVKASLYARKGVKDYWVLNVRDRHLIVHRDPARMRKCPLGYGYKTVTVLGPSDMVRALVRPDVAILVQDLL